MTPICAIHMVEMVCAANNQLVEYPMAQRLYSADLYRCPRGECKALIRAPQPRVEGFMPLYHTARMDVTHKMWNV